MEEPQSHQAQLGVTCTRINNDVHLPGSKYYVGIAEVPSYKVQVVISRTSANQYRQQ